MCDELFSMFAVTYDFGCDISLLSIQTDSEQKETLL